MTKYILRAATGADISRVHELLMELHQFQEMEGCVPREPTIEDLKKELTRDGDTSDKNPANKMGTFTVVVVDKSIKEGDKQQIVGYMIYTFAISIRYGVYCFLNSFLITKDHRKQGLGAMLMGHLEEHLKSVGGSDMYYASWDDNEVGNNFYRRLNPIRVNEEFHLLRMNTSD